LFHVNTLARRTVTVAFSASVDLTTRESSKEARAESSRSSRLVTSSNVAITISFDTRISSTVTSQELTAQNRVTGVDSASEVVGANNGLIDTTSCRGAVVDSASVVVITVKSSVDSNVVATKNDTSSSVGNSLTTVDSASVSVIAVHRLVFAKVCCSVARVIRADVTVIAVKGGGNAQTSGRAALLSLTRTSCANNIHWKLALVAIDSSVLATGTRASAETAVRGTRVAVIAVFGGSLATNTRVTRNHFAGVVVDTNNISGVAAGSRVTQIVLASVSAVANGSRISTTSTVDVGVARVDCAHVVIVTGRRANASFATRAKALASSTTGVTRNINACHNDKLVENVTKLSISG